MRPIVYLIGTGPGDPSLISVRGARYLAAADVVLYDHLVHPRLLRYPRQEAEKIDVGLAAPQPLDQEAINYLLVEKAREGKIVARLKWGDPFLFDRGGQEALVPARARRAIRGRPWHPGRYRHHELRWRSAHLSGRRRLRDVRARARRRKHHGAQRRLGEPCAPWRHGRVLHGCEAAPRDTQARCSPTDSTRPSPRRSSTTARCRRSARPTARCRSWPT